ncbi:MAG: hypothetical protein KF824_01245 [Fimbriimonadaceae bacterium]|nr:MAG: hypothetical protein KF824_01245 [Fimbriimonadaceae bacterium]
MVAKWTKYGLLATMSIAIAVCGYNSAGKLSIEQAEECWYGQMPSSSVEFESINQIATQCGLTERKQGVTMYPDGVRRTTFTKRFTNIGLVSGWHDEVTLDVEFIGDSNLVEAHLDRWDGVAWMILP